jgi:hypothetical protein
LFVTQTASAWSSYFEKLVEVFSKILLLGQQFREGNIFHATGNFDNDNTVHKTDGKMLTLLETKKLPLIQNWVQRSEQWNPFQQISSTKPEETLNKNRISNLHDEVLAQFTDYLKRLFL